MTPSHAAGDDSEQARLEAIVARLGDSGLARPIGHGWTVAAALAHLAFWDRRALAFLEEPGSEGSSAPAGVADQINDAKLPVWLAQSSREARRDAVAAARAIDARVAALGEDQAAELAGRWPRRINRALHRRDHLDEIERALGEA